MKPRPDTARLDAMEQMMRDDMARIWGGDAAVGFVVSDQGEAMAGVHGEDDRDPYGCPHPNLRAAIDAAVARLDARKPLLRKWAKEEAAIDSRMKKERDICPKPDTSPHSSRRSRKARP